MDNTTTYEIWRRSPEGENLVMSDPSEEQVRDWHVALVEQEKINRHQASVLSIPRPVIRYDIYVVTVVRRRVSP